MTDRDLVGGEELVAALSAAARELSKAERGTEMDTLSHIVSAAVQTVPGAEHAGVSLLHRDGAISSFTGSSEIVGEVDRLQSIHREGPCVTALWDEHTVVVDDLSAEADRWPRFAPEAVTCGIASMLSFQLFTRQDTLGALNLYSTERKGFTADSQTLGGLFASHAAAALGDARHVSQLHEALTTRDAIGQAKGILMERFGIGEAEAFTMLIRSSQETNMKLADVARWLTDHAVGRREDD